MVAARRYHCVALPSVGERAVLPKPTSHHILQVCRHPREAELNLFDGSGRELRCRLVDVKGQRAVLEGLEELPPSPPPAGCRTLLLGLCKPTAWETSLRMATELGVQRVLPLLCERSSVRKLRLERWQRVITAACEQSGRRWLPDLEALLPFDSAIALPSLPGQRLVLQPGSHAQPVIQHDMALLVGPEGGLTDKELQQATQAGFVPAGLGPHVLRVDTAVAAALARYGS
jgi:16S rRNA (uracil1498-N3)-methyltransferase